VYLIGTKVGYKEIAMKYFILIFTILAAASCAMVPPAQQLNFQGNQALIAGRYQIAREQYSKALVEAQKSDDQQYIAIAMYGLARSNGYSCHYQEAEEWFIKSISLRDNIPNSETAYLSQNILELARLYIAERKFKEASVQFGRAVPMLESSNIEKEDPIGYANALEDYEIALRLSGEIQESIKIKEKITYLRNTYSSRKANFTPTPYPSKCT
jgi:tetratricopeptide (TPR) repeat protein